MHPEKPLTQLHISNQKLAKIYQEAATQVPGVTYELVSHSQNQIEPSDVEFRITAPDTKSANLFGDAVDNLIMKQSLDDLATRPI